MDYIDYLRALRASWWMVALGTLLGLGAAVGVYTSATPQYETTSQLFVSANGTDDVSSAMQGSEFSKQRVASYQELITGKELATAVVRRLDLDLTPSQLRSEISAEAVPSTVLLDVTVTDPSPERALAIAQAVDVEFAAQVARLETPPGATVAPITVTTVEQPDLPTRPTSPDALRIFSVALVLGLLAGVGGALLRSRLDTSVKEDESAVQAAGAPVVGRVGQDAELSVSQLPWEAGAVSTEAFRQLRTNLQFLRPDSPVRTVMISSATPSEGKTTVAVNLATALAKSGRTVVLVEADLRRPAAARQLGLVGGVGLANVLTGQADLDDVLQPHGDGTLTVLAAGPTTPNPSELLASSAMARLLAELSERYDLVVIDAAPLLPVADAVGLAVLVDGTLLCARHGRTTRHQLAQSRAALDRVGATTLGVVLTMVPPKAMRDSGTGYGYGYAPEQATDRRGLRLRRRAVASRPAPRHSVPAAPLTTADLPVEHETVGGARTR